MTSRLVRDILPDVYAELEVVVEAGDPHLARKLDALTVAESCGCGDAFCASFYTGPRPRNGWSDEGSHRTVTGSNQGLVFAMDVVDDTIRYVEIFSAETEPGRRVADVLKALGAEKR